ncbi:MAG: 30S ribosomal protein S17 [Chloroflexi bacterium]|nr:30S ribosomal protein S17 [Chloroflexota bacterium]
MAKAMRKVRTGSVVRVRMQKTAVVEMVWKQRDRLYRKQVRRVARFKVHDPLQQCQLGDVVRIQETRPISKTKHWRLLEILERRVVAEIRPIDLEADALMVTEEEQAAVDEQVDAEEEAVVDELDAVDEEAPETEEQDTEK